jgi:hypothetical protein
VSTAAQRVDQLNQVLDHDGSACSSHEKRLHSHRKKLCFLMFTAEQHSRSRKTATTADGSPPYNQTALWTFFAVVRPTRPWHGGRFIPILSALVKRSCWDKVDVDRLVQYPSITKQPRHADAGSLVSVSLETLSSFLKKELFDSKGSQSNNNR